LKKKLALIFYKPVLILSSLTLNANSSNNGANPDFQLYNQYVSLQNKYIIVLFCLIILTVLFVGLLGTFLFIQLKNKRLSSDNKKTELWYKSLFSNTFDAILVVDDDGHFVHINPAASKLLGCSLEELSNLTLFDVTPTGKHKTIEIMFQSLMHYGELRGEFEILNRKGEILYVDYSAIADINPGNHVLFFHDITASKMIEKKLQNTLDDKDALVRELYHRIKNNLQLVSSMLGLKLTELPDEKTRAIFIEVQNKIQSMALIHQKLYQSKNLTILNLGDYLKDVSNLLIERYSGSRSVALDIAYDKTEVPMDIALPCGLIIAELISNTFKFAVKKHGGHITIRLLRLDANHIDFTYADSGGEINEDFDIFTEGSMGIQTVIALVEGQLGGKISYRTRNGLRYSMVIRDDLYQNRL
jgi:PAS domain S-box-containing protein